MSTLLPIRQNTRNGYKVLRLHYSVDPDKDAVWYENARKKMPEEARWSREMEIDWDAAGGNLVYPYFQRYQSRIVREPFEIKPEMGGWFTAGFDHGALNPTAFDVVWCDEYGIANVVWEYYKPGHYLEHVEAIKQCPYFDKVNGQIWCDPSMVAATQQTASGLKSMIDLYREEGISLLPAPRMDRVVRAQRLGALWNGGNLDDSEPKLYIFSSCSNLIRELRMLRHEQWTGISAAKRNQHEGILKKDDHSWDSLCYLATANHFFETKEQQENPDSMGAYMREQLERDQMRSAKLDPFFQQV